MATEDKGGSDAFLSVTQNMGGPSELSLGSKWLCCFLE